MPRKISASEALTELRGRLVDVELLLDKSGDEYRGLHEAVLQIDEMLAELSQQTAVPK